MTEGLRRRQVKPESSSGELITAADAAAMQDIDITESRHYAHPEEEFPRWGAILNKTRTEFVSRAKLLGSSAAVQDPDTFYQMVNEIVVEGHPEVQPVDLPRLVELLKAHLFGYGALEDYMRIPGLEELYFNRWDQGFFIASGKKYRITDQIFSSSESMRSFLDRVASENGLELNLQKPILDAALSDGSRLNATIEPIAVDGADFIIRKHKNIPFEISDLLAEEMITPELARDLQLWVQGGMNIVVSGGTASGKTSFLNTIGKAFIPPSDRVLILENRKELQIETSDCKYFQTREDPTRPGSGSNDITLDVLVRSVLRKRPRRIVVGEVRGAEAYDALDAWNTGHEGSLCTIHANSAVEAISRLESLSSRADLLDPIGIRRLIASSVDLIVQLSLDESSGRRSVLEVAQILHEFKYNAADPDVRSAVREAQESGSWQKVREEIIVLPIYSTISGKLVKLNSLIPVIGRGPQK